MKLINRTLPLRGNIYSVLVLRLGLVMAVYTICRLAFYLYNRDLLGIDDAASFGLIMLGGVRFDLSAVVYTNLLVIVLHLLPLKARLHPHYQRLITWIYWLCNLPMLLLNLGDIVYYRFSGRRTTLSVFEEFGHEDPLGFIHFLWSYWGITLSGIVMIWLWITLYRRIIPNREAHVAHPALYYPSSILLSALAIGLSIGAMRGGFLASTRPISPANASAYVDRAEQRAMVLNTPFTMIRLADKFVLPPYEYMSREEARRHFDPLRQAPIRTEYSGLLKGRNVVLIIWESMAREWVGGLNRDLPNYEGYTPFVDSLLQHSYYYECAYAGGGKSIDAMPNLLASIPKPQSSFVLSPYSGNRISSIVACAREAGYETAFFHNAPNGSMGFDAMARQLGFESYFGKTEFGDDSQFDGKWGIWDEPFLQFLCHEIGRMREPFFVGEFTTTSHEPYRIPEQYESVFAHGEHPIHRCIRYTDHALKRFFETAKRMPWYERTLFVITADHAVPGHRPEYKTSQGLFRIPMIFFDPSRQLIGRDSTTIVQQADLMPTLIDLLGFEHPVVAFGHNMFAKDEAHWAVSTLDGAYQLIHGEYVLQFDGACILSLYNYRTDPLLRQDLQQTHPEVIKELLPLMQAYLQQLSERMRLNQLQPDKTQAKQCKPLPKK